MLYETLKLLKHKLLKPILSIPHLRIVDKRNIDIYKKNFDILKSMVNVRELKYLNGDFRESQLRNFDFAKEIINELEQNDIKPFMVYGTLLGAERHKGFIPWDDDTDFGVMREDFNRIIELAKSKFIFCYHKINRYQWMSSSKQWILNLLKTYPNKIIFLRFPRLIKVIKGTCIKDYVAMDIFSFDYYSENYKYSDYVKKSKQNLDKLWLINNIEKECKYLDIERTNDINIVKQSNKIFYGNDNSDSQNYRTLEKYTDFMNAADFFPLKKMIFEGTEFWAPNNHIKILEDYFGQNWCSIPDNIIPPHTCEREG